MSDLYEIDWKRLTDGIETNLPDQEAQDLLLFLETCVKRVEPEGIIRVREHQIAAALNRLVALPEGTYAIVRLNDE